MVLGPGQGARVASRPASGGATVKVGARETDRTLTIYEDLKGAKGDPSSSRPGIDVVQASQHRPLGDGSVAHQGSGQRALEAETSMGTVEVVVVGELREHGAQMPFVDDDHVIKALLPDRAN